MKKIIINKKEVEVPSGLVSGEHLYESAECGEQCLYFNREDKIDIPVQKGDFIVIHGGESFVIGKPPDDDNPKLRNPICPKFNGKEAGLSFPVVKNYGKEIKSKDDKFPNGRLFVDLPDAADEEIRDDMRLIVQDKDSYFVIPPSEDASDDHVDVEKCIKNERRVPQGQKYLICVDGKKHAIELMVITGAGILTLVGKTANEWSLNQKLKGGERQRILPDDSVDLSACGVERFETVRDNQQQGNE